LKQGRQSRDKGARINAMFVAGIPRTRFKTGDWKGRHGLLISNLVKKNI